MMGNLFIIGLFVLTVTSTAFCMYEVILSRFENEPKNSNIFNADKLKVGRFNRTTHVLTGSFDINVDSIQDWDGHCTLNRKMGNEYKLLPFKLGPQNVCDLLKEEKMFYPAIVESSENLPPLGTCDFKVQTYYVNNYLPDLNKFPKVFESGDYMVDCTVSRHEEIVQVLKVYAQIYNIQDAKKA